MTKIVGSYSQFERDLIAAAYYSSNILEKDAVSLDEIRSLFEFTFEKRWAINALNDYWAKGLTKERIHNGGIGEQRVWLTSDGLKRAEGLIESGGITIRRVAAGEPTVEGHSASETLSEGEKNELLKRVSTAETELDGLHLGNVDRANAIAFLTAIRALAEAPEPPKDIIWKIIERANSISGIASLFVSIAGLFV